MTLPKDFAVRPVMIEDAEAVAELTNLCSLEVTGKPGTDADEIRNEWRAPSFDMRADTLAIFSAENKLVGYAEAWHQAPNVKCNLWFKVHPDYRDLGLGEVLLDWGMARAEEVMALAEPDTRFVVGSWLSIAEKDPHHHALIEQYGFEVARYFYEMVIDLDEAPPAVNLPEGITIRTFNRDADLRAVVIADTDAFRDHWGFVESPIEEELKDWAQWIDGDKKFDPSLWFLAMDGDEIAGVCLCRSESHEDPNMGYVNSLGVRRGWRKRGLGLALLRHAFGEFYKRGKQRVGLGVDASSLTGALRLYERAGMHVNRKSTSFEKVLREGKDLVTRELDE